VKFKLATVLMAIGLGGTSAYAADLPAMPMRAPAAVVAQTWSGVYVGANAGYAWGKTKGEFNSTAPGNFNMDGGLAGAQIGVNYQINSLVLGVEADYQWSDIQGSNTAVPFGILLTNTARIQHFGTVRGRVGWAWDRVLIYGTGGWAFGARTEVTTAALGISLAGQETLSGWTAGGGLEYALSPSWSAKVEYLHMALSEKQFLANVCLPGNCLFGADVDLVRVGLNFRGSWY
jgi:outer membrane immunogenic protein